MKDKTILIISPEAWGTNFVSKHHYATYLSKNNTVYFLNPVLGSKINPFGKINIAIEQINKNLVQVNYQNLLPRLNKLPKFIQEYIYKKQAKQIQKALNINKLDIVWSFDPNRFWNLDNFKSDKKIYHSVDVHSTKYESDISASADLIIIISKYLKNKIGTKTKTIQLNHGVYKPSKINEFRPNIKGTNPIKVGFVGNMTSSNIDFDILLETAKKTTFVADIIIIGPIKTNNLGGNYTPEISEKVKLLQECVNVYFYGEIASGNLNSILSKIDIHLILYKNFEKNIAPHKLSNYLETGSVILSSFIYDIDTYPNESIVALNDNNDIPNKLIELINNLDYWNSDSLSTVRKNYCQNNLYSTRINTIFELIKN